MLNTLSVHTAKDLSCMILILLDRRMEKPIVNFIIINYLEILVHYVPMLYNHRYAYLYYRYTFVVDFFPLSFAIKKSKSKTSTNFKKKRVQ
jgi:hypothetical protein